MLPSKGEARDRSRRSRLPAIVYAAMTRRCRIRYPVCKVAEMFPTLEWGHC